MEHSKRAIWLAVNSELGDRLVEIAQEHLKLANMLPPRPSQTLQAAGLDVHSEAREIIHARIEQLRVERTEIIRSFEGQ